MSKSGLTVAALMFALAAPLAAQSLGDLARQEEARRKTITNPGKVYTNDSLRAEPAPTLQPSPAAAGQAPSTQPASPSPSQAQAKPGEKPAAAAQPPDETKTEAYWRQRITEARDGLSRAQMFQEALQSRINALSTDFVNRDDPAQRQVISADRQKALAELERVKQEIQQYQKAINDIQEEARRAGVPPGWLR